MKDIRQSPQFATFMQNLGWEVKKIDSIFIYLRRFPFLGFFAKIPRAKPPFPFLKAADLKRSQRIFRLKIAPDIKDTEKNYGVCHQQFLEHGFRTEQFPFNPTTTIHIDLDQTEEKIFQSFAEAKRRGVRRAIKNGVVIEESNNLGAFIEIRKKQYFLMGFLVEGEMRKLWSNFYPKYGTLLLAYDSIKNRPVAGILLLFYEQIAYYWYASSLKVGKKLFAPTLLVWEALKLSKKRDCKIFDFEGIADERFPGASSSWQGFTKFKEGFGGKKIIYLENFYL